MRCKVTDKLFILFCIIHTDCGARRAKASHLNTPSRQYDSQERYLGRVNRDGRRFDSQGRYFCRSVIPSGRLLDRHGARLGTIAPDGRHYNAHGKYLGSFDSAGRLYDSRGRYQGKVVEGVFWDTQGKYLGRIGPSDAVEIESNLACDEKIGARTLQVDTGLPDGLPAFGENGELGCSR